ncbi:IS3 family transposase [Brassicibacter mesophilus]|uniref:IS3 family transposase n=1 Tax=Brassicibacter mesophilus TaxID=745119 RepID=UPI003D244171
MLFLPSKQKDTIKKTNLELSTIRRTYHPYDNALTKSFYKIIKRELIQDANFEAPEQAQQEVFKYIELYYNTKKIYSSHGYLSPTKFEEVNS